MSFTHTFAWLEKQLKSTLLVCLQSYSDACNDTGLVCADTLLRGCLLAQLPAASAANWGGLPGSLLLSQGVPS